MAIFRDGTIWFATIESFLEQKETIGMGAISFELDSGVLAPPLRSRLSFGIFVAGWRCAPLVGDVVFSRSIYVGLQLDMQSRNALVELARQIAERAPQKGTAPIEVQKPVAQPAPPITESTPAQAPTKQAAPTREQRATQVSDVWVPNTEELNAVRSTSVFTPLPAGTVLQGNIVGVIGIGVLDILFENEAISAPSDNATLVHLFRFLSQRRATGKLVFKGPTHTKTVLLKNGTPLAVEVQPPKEDEQLGQILIKLKWVAPHVLAEVLRRAKNANIGLATALAREKIVDTAKLNRALSHQTYRRLRDLFDWRDTTFSFNEQEISDEHTFYPISVSRLLFEYAQELLRNERMEHLELLLKHHHHKYPQLVQLEDQTFRLLVPDEKTRLVFQRSFDGTRPLRHAIATCALGRIHTLRLVLYLLAARALQLRTESQQPGLSQQDRLRHRVQTLEVQDHFQRLGLSYVAEEHEIQPAYERAVTEFLPGGRYYQGDAITSNTVAKMYQEALQALSTPASRIAYRAKVLPQEHLIYFSALIAQQADVNEFHGNHEKAKTLRRVVEELTSAAAQASPSVG